MSRSRGSKTAMLAVIVGYDLPKKVHAMAAD